MFFAQNKVYLGVSWLYMHSRSINRSMFMHGYIHRIPMRDYSVTRAYPTIGPRCLKYVNITVSYIIHVLHVIKYLFYLHFYWLYLLTISSFIIGHAWVL